MRLAAEDLPPLQPTAYRPFGRYEPLGELGRGGMGVVLAARDRELKRVAALKIFHARGASADLVQRFLVEAQATSQLEHPNIVPVYDSGVTPEGDLYYSMKLVRGRSLAGLLDELPLPHLLNIFRDVANAVAYAHQRGVVHRDLKPENVMVGEFGQVQVADWGLARLLGRAGEGARAAALRLTQDGDVLGTPRYMAPEQAWGDVEKIDARTDVYALGAMLYRMIAGRAPIAAATAEEAVQKAGRGEVQPLPAQAPPELAAIVRRAMELDPADRYPGAQVLAEEVRAYLEGRVVAAAEYTPWRLLLKWAQRNRAAAAGIAAAILVLAGGLVGATVWARQARALKAWADQARIETEIARSRAETVALEASRKASVAARRHQAEAEFLKAQRDVAAGNAMSGLAHAIAALRLNPTGDAAALVWDLHARHPQRLRWTSPRSDDDPTGYPGHAGLVCAVAFSPDGQRVVSGSYDQTVRLWDLATKKETARLAGHRDRVSAVTFSPDGARVASRDDSGVVLVWNVATGERTEGLSAENAESLLEAWSLAAGGALDQPTRLPVLGVVILKDEAAWRSVWRDQERDEHGLPQRVLQFLDSWEQDIGMRVNLDTGMIERLPTPGSAYADDPKIAERCR